MDIYTKTIECTTKGKCDIIDLTSKVEGLLKELKMNHGQLTVFGIGSTIGITTIEYEPGLVLDFPDLMERLVPASKNYHHNSTWNDGNGLSHLRASLIGSSCSLPFVNGEILLGTYQQIVVIEFDINPRHRKIIVQFIGE